MNVLREVDGVLLTLELKVLISSEFFVTQVGRYLVGLAEFCRRNFSPLVRRAAEVEMSVLSSSVRVPRKLDSSWSNCEVRYSSSPRIEVSRSFLVSSSPVNFSYFSLESNREFSRFRTAPIEIDNSLVY